MGVCVARTPSEIERCQAAVFWRGRFYEGLQLIDANGETHEVVNVAVHKPTSAFAQRLARLLDLRVVVKLDIRPRGPASLPDVIRAVDSAIDEDPEAFEEFSGPSVSWWRQAIAHCVTVRDLMGALQGSEIDD
jgi:hypothetical protein